MEPESALHSDVLESTLPLEVGALTALPIYIEPEAEEGLVSWLGRLANRLQTSVDVVVRIAFNVEHDRLVGRWWARPDSDIVSRICQRSDLSPAQVHGMTLFSWQPQYRDDEADERFAGHRFRARKRVSDPNRYVVCHACLKTDATRHIRRAWSIGWVAVCSIHATVLMNRCLACSAPLSFDTLAKPSSVSLSSCVQCDEPLIGDGIVADPDVIELQERMLLGKIEGTTSLGKLGNFRWVELVAFFDVLLGTLWTAVSSTERDNIIRIFRDQKGGNDADENNPLGDRYRCLQFLTWITSGWLESEPSAIAEGLLSIWMESPKNLVFEPAVRERLLALLV